MDYENKMKLENCDLLFYKGGTGNIGLRFIQWAIKRITRGPYCHVGILIGAGDNRTVGEAWTTGFKIHDYYGYFDKEVEARRIIIKRIKGLTKEQKSIIIKEVKSYKNTPYDYLDILDIFFKSIFNIETKFGNSSSLICSESVDKALIVAGVDLVPENDSDETNPNEMARSNLLLRVKI